MARKRVFAVLLLFYVAMAYSHPGHFWQLTDVHWDPTYWTTRQSCNEGGMHGTLGPLGDYECDAPWELLKASIDAMRQIWPEPDFILWTGDNDHHPKDQKSLSTKLAVEITLNISRAIRDAFPNTSVYFCIGNHDYFPVNDLPPTENTIYNQLADEWTKWFEKDPSQEGLFRKGAFYSLLARDRLRIVSMNTNFYYHRNSVTRDMPDPGDQFKWFDELMKRSRRNGEKVYLVTHIPPGHIETSSPTSWFTADHNQRFVELVVKHSDVIVAMFSAHQHTDTFRLFYKDVKPVGYMLLAPSVTPWRARIGPNKLSSAHNPALRLYKYDRHEFGLQDMFQYYLDLNHVTSKVQAKWKLEYNMTSVYDIPNITANSLQRVVDTFKDESSASFSKYVRYNTVSTKHPSVTACDHICKQSHICAITRVKYQEYTKCSNDVSSGSVTLQSCLFTVALLSTICVYLLGSY